MHYGPTLFAIDSSLPTITNKDGSPMDPSMDDFTKVFLMNY